MADTKLSNLTNKTNLATTDLLYAVDPFSKKLTISNLIKNFGPGNGILTPPVDANYSWVNQGTASIATGDYGISLIGQAATGNSLKIRDKAAPATPYTIIAAMYGTMFNQGSGTPAWGVIFRNVAAGTVVAFGFGFSSGANNYNIITIDKFTNPTTYSGASYITVIRGCGQIGNCIWFKIQDNGVNRISSLSFDGVNFIQIHSVVRTDFLTADRVGFYLDVNNGSTFSQIVTLASWQELNS